MRISTSLLLRFALSLLVAAIGSYIIYHTYATHPKFTSDFGNWYYAARALLSGDDPYTTVGPNLKYQWPTLFVYPLTVVFIAIPFVWLSEPLASSAFVFISTFVMVMAITRKGFHLLPMLLTPPFQMSVALGQLSLLFTAAMFYPILNFLTAIKPQAGLPVVAATRDWRTLIWATVVGILLVMTSLVIISDWPTEWLHIIREDPRYLPPISRMGGFLLPLALLRWRRREAWLLLVTATLPQSLTFYYLLPLFTIPRTFAESLLLATTATLGIYGGAVLMPAGLTGIPFYEWSGSIAVISVFLPCLVLLLIRENTSSDLPKLIPFVRRLLFLSGA